MTGEGQTYLEQKRERVECRYCGKEMATGSLDTYRMSQHGKTKERMRTWTDAATRGGGGGIQQHIGQISPRGVKKECPVDGCPGRAGTRTVMRVRFWRRHVRDVMIILEGIYIFDSFIAKTIYNIALLLLSSILFLVTINTHIPFKLIFFATLNFILNIIIISVSQNNWVSLC